MFDLPKLALSIRQPWAHCIIHLGKPVENRNWPIRLRGPVCIHAAKGMTPSPHVAPVRLKPLEWRSLVCSDRHAEVADSVLGRWEMWSFPNGSTHIMKPGEHQGSVYEDTPEEAKAYLERVYQRRMAPALASAEGSTDAE